MRQSLLPISPEEKLHVKSKNERSKHIFSLEEESLCGKVNKKEYHKHHYEKIVEARKIVNGTDGSSLGSYCQTCLNALKELIEEQNRKTIDLPEKPSVMLCQEEDKIWSSEKPRFCPFCGKDIGKAATHVKHEVVKQ